MTGCRRTVHTVHTYVTYLPTVWYRVSLYNSSELLIPNWLKKLLLYFCLVDSNVTHVADGEGAVWHGHVKAGFLPNKERMGEALLLYVLQGQLQKFNKGFMLKEIKE